LLAAAYLKFCGKASIISTGTLHEKYASLWGKREGDGGQEVLYIASWQKSDTHQPQHVL
jgi:hypothetical protein